jgi:predicted SAM-dependent methyltransferase
MDFRIKCCVQSILSRLPGNEKLNFFFQRFVAKNLPMRLGGYITKWEQAKRHMEAYRRYADVTPSVCYEIGSGWDLAVALSLASIAKVSKIYCVDVREHLRVSLLNNSLRMMFEQGILDRQYIATKDSRQKILDEFKIKYVVVDSCGETAFQDHEIDFIFSNNVFEHIPPDSLVYTLKECKRVLSEEGIMSISIDYGDHYCTFDKSITPYNMLKYSNKQWLKYNHELHYINRLRHSDFVKLFERAGFDILEEDKKYPSDHRNVIATVPIHKEFLDKYSFADLCVTGAFFVLRHAA